MKELLLVFTLLGTTPDTFDIKVTGIQVENCSKEIAKKFDGVSSETQTFAFCAGDMFTNIPNLIPGGVVPPKEEKDDLNLDLMPLR